MKFSEHLQAHLTPEWRTQYIQYESLKVFIIDCVNEVEKEGPIEPDSYLPYDGLFFVHCSKELEKINNFFAEKLAEAKRKFLTLNEELTMYQEHAFKSRINLHISTDFIRKLGGGGGKSPPASPKLLPRASKSVCTTADEIPIHASAAKVRTTTASVILSNGGNGGVERPVSGRSSTVGPEVDFVGGESVLSLQAYMRRRTSASANPAEDNGGRLSRRSSRKNSISPGRSASQSRNHREVVVDVATPEPQTQQSAAAQQQKQQRRKKRASHNEKKHVKNLHALKLGFSEFYLSLILLQNYQTLNFTGFRKILKKHDKLFGCHTGQQWRQENVDNAHFYTDKTVDEMIVRVENLYTDHLEHGDRPKAMKRLRVPPLAEQQNPLKTFRIGFLNGVLLVQVIVIFLSVSYLQLVSDEMWHAEWKLFRGPLVIGLFTMLLGVNIYVWRSSGVNYVLIFEIDPRNHLTHLEMLDLGSAVLVLWCTCVLYYLYSPLMGSPPLIGPLVLVGLLMLYFFNPFPCLHHKSRRWLLNVLKRIFLAPFYPVKFADFWLADQLNSLAPLFIDLPFVLCYYSSDVEWPSLHSKSRQGMGFNLSIEESGLETHFYCGSISWVVHLSRILIVFPAWFRFAQCLRRYYDMPEKKAFPHLWNAGKYSTSFFVVIFNYLSVEHPNDLYYLVMQGVAQLTASCYTLYWDIYLDWGLLRSRSKGSYLLRDQLVYRYVWSYYLAALQNIVLRFAWVFRITATAIQWKYESQMRYVLVIAEVVRRFIWNFFRLENEHLNNVGRFRAVRDICIKPLPCRLGNGNGENSNGKHTPSNTTSPHGGAVRGILRKPVQVLSSMARNASHALLDNASGRPGLRWVRHGGDDTNSARAAANGRLNRNPSRRHTYANLKDLHQNSPPLPHHATSELEAVLKFSPAAQYLDEEGGLCTGGDCPVKEPHTRFYCEYSNSRLDLQSGDGETNESTGEKTTETFLSLNSGAASGRKGQVLETRSLTSLEHGETVKLLIDTPDGTSGHLNVSDGQATSASTPRRVASSEFDLV